MFLWQSQRLPKATFAHGELLIRVGRCSHLQQLHADVPGCYLLVLWPQDI